MTNREPESLVESDPHGLLFGAEGEHPGEVTGSFAADLLDEDHRKASRSQRREAERQRGERARTRRTRRLVVILAAGLVVIVGVGAAIFVPKVLDRFSGAADYEGSGTAGTNPPAIVITQGESASQIAATLEQAHVVKSVGAFVDACDAHPDCSSLQAGTYTLRLHMSAESALALLLDPSSRTAGTQLLITEGETLPDIVASMRKLLPDQQDAIDRAVKDVAGAGVPLGYGSVGADSVPASLEGFLFPATYDLAPGATPQDMVQKMTGAFIGKDKELGFALGAEKLKISPYEALIIASIAQSEARYPSDMAKVARVMLNRLHKGMPLQADATTVYGARLAGKGKGDINVATFDSPYNSYLHRGLPPTPISNPGSDAMNAAVNPAKGNWIYYVNADAAGHLYFTADEGQFAIAKQKCIENNWGCGY